MCKKPSFSFHKKFLKMKQNIRYLTGIMRGLLPGGRALLRLLVLLLASFPAFVITLAF